MLSSATTAVWNSYKPSDPQSCRSLAHPPRSWWGSARSTLTMADDSVTDGQGTLNATSATATASGTPDVSSVIDLLHLVEKLKTQPRTGWVYRGVEKPESIADHMYRMAILAMTVAGTEYDQNKLVKMAIVHDLAEAIVGDITPVDGVSEEAKYSRELAALKEIQTMIGIETAVAQEVGQLWAEYEAAVTNEAKLCKDFDKIEMILQAFEYETSQGKNLQEFFDSTAGKWRTPFGESLAKEVVRRRDMTLGSKP